MDGEARLETCIHNRAFHPLPSLLRVDEKTAEQALYSGDYLQILRGQEPILAPGLELDEQDP